MEIIEVLKQQWLKPKDLERENMLDIVELVNDVGLHTFISIVI